MVKCQECYYVKSLYKNMHDEGALFLKDIKLKELSESTSKELDEPTFKETICENLTIMHPNLEPWLPPGGR